MEGSKPIITGAQRELIEKHAAVLGEDGKAMIEDIEEEAKAPNKLPADVFKLIESCLYSLGQKAKKQSLSDGVIKQKEPERLLQVEAIREHTTMLHGARLNGDRLTAESLRKATLKLVSEFMEAVDKDKDDGWTPTRLGCGKIRCMKSRPEPKSTNPRRVTRARRAQLGPWGR